MSRNNTKLRRRDTIPQELDEMEDVCINQESFDEDDVEDDDQDDEDYSSSYYMKQIHLLPKEIRNLIAGGIAGMIAKSFVAPLDRVKILYQVSSVQFQLRQLPSVIQRIIQTEGYDALWKGNVTTMIRVFPYSGIQFMTYDRMKSIFLKKQQQQSQVGAGGGDKENHKVGLTPIESLFAGMVAGTASVICTYPLDLTRAQLAVLKKHKKHKQRAGHGHGHGQNAAHATTVNKSFIHVIRDNYKLRGFQGLWRGITPTIIGIIPYSGIAFTLNEQGKREIIHTTGRDITTIERMICGGLAGLIAQTLTYPIEVTRRRMQTVGLLSTNDVTAFSSLNCPITTGRNTASAATTSATSSPMASTASTVTRTTAIPGSSSVSSSSMAAASSRRMTATSSSSSSPPTLISTIRDLYVEQGIRGFYKGVTMNWIKGPMAFSISFTCYDHIQKNIFMSHSTSSSTTSASSH